MGEPMPKLETIPPELQKIIAKNLDPKSLAMMASASQGLRAVFSAKELNANKLLGICQKLRATCIKLKLQIIYLRKVCKREGLHLGTAIGIKTYAEKVNATANKIMAFKAKLSKLNGREYDEVKEEFTKVELALSAVNDEIAWFCRS